MQLLSSKASYASLMRLPKNQRESRCSSQTPLKGLQAATSTPAALQDCSCHLSMSSEDSGKRICKHIRASNKQHVASRQQPLSRKAVRHCLCERISAERV